MHCKPGRRGKGFYLKVQWVKQKIQAECVRCLSCLYSSQAPWQGAMDLTNWQSVLTRDISWQVLTVSWPLPRLATILGFRCAFMYPFGGDIGLCLYIVLTVDYQCSLSPDLGVFWSGRGMWPANLGAANISLLEPSSCSEFHLVPPHSGTPILSPVTPVLNFVLQVLTLVL